MKFRPYCMLVIGDTIGVLDEIKKISETDPITIDGKGLFIATFISASSPNELTEFFKLDKRNFVLFELNQETSGVNIMKPETHEGLFGFLKTFKQESIDDMTDRLMNDIKLTSDTRDFKSSIKKRKIVDVKVAKITKDEIAKMSEKQKQALLDEMIDSGLKNLTEEDKEILELLAK